MAFKNGYVLFAICLLFGRSVLCDSARVLFVGVYTGGSHVMALIPIGRSLVDRGHEVTFLINDLISGKYVQPEYTDFLKFETYSFPSLNRDYEHLQYKMNDLAFAGKQYSQMIVLASMFSDLNRRSCEALFSDGKLMKRLQDVDVVVVDVVWPCGIYMKAFFSKQRGTKIRGVVVSTSAAFPYIQQLAGSPVNPSYQPMLSTGLASSMSFPQRVSNTISYLVGNIFTYNLISKPLQGIVDVYGLDPEMKSSIHTEVDLYLINSDFSIGFPYPLTPNVIPVGGLTARPAQRLEDELERFMQSSGEQGVVVFSLGSNFTEITKSKPELTEDFLEALGRLPHKVLFHLRADPPERFSENIKFLSWLPLQDVLGHPKTRLLVYHGGNNGFLEAVYHGVPLVVMPLVGDQVDVSVMVKELRLGTTLDKTRLNADYIYQTLTEALGNPEYSKNAKRASAILRDRPMTAPDRAAFWIEHVIKHGGSYMRSPAHDLSFIQYHLLDVVLILTLICLTVMLLAYKLLRLCICFCFRVNKGDKLRNE
ncbi:UDP-glucuronosyltransferase 2B7-like [Lytechinus pictus]|uniref:UDP-glucuronosyltransferase 2B7-like n=1 Tax=Lytechinus pictus TaxID=7653 RepID=UPI0030BA2676